MLDKQVSSFFSKVGSCPYACCTLISLHEFDFAVRITCSSETIITSTICNKVSACIVKFVWFLHELFWIAQAFTFSFPNLKLVIVVKTLMNAQAEPYALACTKCASTHPDTTNASAPDFSDATQPADNANLIRPSTPDTFLNVPRRLKKKRKRVRATAWRRVVIINTIMTGTLKL